MNRRRYLAATGTALTTPLVGCLRSDSGATPTGETTDTTGSSTDTREPTSETPPEPDAADRSIDGLLHNETSEPRQFALTVTDSEGAVLVEEERTVGPTGTALVPRIGRPGTTRTFEVAVGDAAVSEELAFDVARTPERVDGYVGVRYAGPGDVAVDFTPVEYPHTEVLAADPRVDAPPHAIERPETPEDPGDGDGWNEEYLGDAMATTPSLDFTTLAHRGVARPPLRHRGWEENLYWVTLVADGATRDTLLDLDALDEPARQRLREVDFDDSIVVAVETGYGSGSVEHRWTRVEETQRGVRLHGYYTDPWIQTDDLTTRGSVVEVDRPAGELALARVSLTVSEDRRIHFNSTEGLVTVE
ncbi:hypothetical protein [Halobellus limi]|uniref:Uncharacterized protein n=1 Tax=Halobellus limi TaxID=699433 RepID=A0A1H5T0K7_9EURY|nr:hypothetical protein [Halobellus limi]QCC47453.1 hypothetical protein DV707_07130 [Halobellus limi]SEF55631.1 hypothetical protein SAMN04488133_0118 [Halobellus limi]